MFVTLLRTTLMLRGIIRKLLVCRITQESSAFNKIKFCRRLRNLLELATFSCKYHRFFRMMESCHLLNPSLLYLVCSCLCTLWSINYCAWCCVIKEQVFCILACIFICLYLVADCFRSSFSTTKRVIKVYVLETDYIFCRNNYCVSAHCSVWIYLPILCVCSWCLYNPTWCHR